MLPVYHIFRICEAGKDALTRAAKACKMGVKAGTGMEQIRFIAFDLDGTLWDSAEGVADSWNAALERLGRPERLTAEDVHGVMGMTMAQVICLTFSAVLMRLMRSSTLSSMESSGF